MSGLGDPWSLAEESETGRYVTIRTKDGGRTVARVPQTFRSEVGALLKAPEMRKLLYRFVHCEPGEYEMKLYQQMAKMLLDDVDKIY